MIRWDGPELPQRGEDGQDPEAPEPFMVEAHRRHRIYDSESGLLVREVHEAVRTLFRPRAAPERQIAGPDGTDPHPIIAIGLGALMHGCVAWMGLATMAFSPHPAWVLVLAALIPFVLGWRFLVTHLLVIWIIGSLLLAFDSWTAWAMVLPLAGLIAPGKWVVGQW